MAERVRLLHIAARCKTSVSTVSEIIANPDHPRYSAETRRRVVDAARGLGYKPHALARALATGKSRIVGVSCGHIGLDLNGAKAIAAAERVISGNGHHLLLHVSQNPADWRDLIAHNQVDFLIALANRPLIEREAEEPVGFEGRVAIVGSKSVARVAPNHRAYTWDDVAGGRMAVDYLIARGHRRVALLRGAMPPSDPKVSGALERLTEAGISPQVASLESEEDSYSAGRQMLAQVLDGDPGTTAVFCRSSHLASGVYAEIRSRGLQVARDISVVAYYDHQDILGLDPPLTCVHAPIVEATCKAVADYFSGVAFSKGGSVTFPGHIVERASVGSV